MSDCTGTTSPYNLVYVEGLYGQYLRDRQSVPSEWRAVFAGLRNGGGAEDRRGPSFHTRSLFNPASPPAAARAAEMEPLQGGVRDRLNQLIRNYRVRGHMLARLDPLGSARPCPPELELGYYGFRDSELDLLTGCSALPYDEPLSIREILQRLRNTYCRSIGAQFMHLDDPAARRWLQHRMESTQNRLALSRAEQLRILVRLTDAVIFEEFLRKKFIGAKTFSLEGSETLLPLLDLAIEKASRQGVRDVVIGMAHRGRLNVLANIIGKPSRDIFREFADAEPELWSGRGDVRYHLGYSGTWTTADDARVELSLCFNPSHLEFINPVVLGRVRARQDRRGDRERQQVLGLLIHGDAAFPGEGIVQETLNLSRLSGYRVGGVLHVIINNQIGFTTPPEEARSTVYATDVARMLQSPIFHVNGEDPEAVAQVVELALDYRAEFNADVFIDMYGYRRWGHNETDEPSFTQPLLYRAIQKRPSIRESYLKHLLQLKGVTPEEAEDIARQRHEKLEQQLSAVRKGAGTASSQSSSESRQPIGDEAVPTLGRYDEPDTGVETDRLSDLLEKLTRLPSSFHLHPKLERGMEARWKMAAGERPLDWATAEALALASLATEGVRIRLTGQDTPRGTFSQRHAALFDQQDGYPYLPLQHLAPDQAPVEILNSPLSEAGALGFEYGYSLDCPDGLVLWEAQFGDFVNAAQVIVDQFIASAEDKWQQLSGLVLLLPHGFEGMGPEHSSARLERFLSLAAEDNIRVVQPTTPAQYFHCLRRQGLSRQRKPLIVLTPKSLLRHPQVVSPLADFSDGGFHPVLPDAAHRGYRHVAAGILPAVEPGILPGGMSHPQARTPAPGGRMPPSTAGKMPAATRVLLCSGKIYYELAGYRDAHKRDDVAIVRLEQLYPLSIEQLEAALPPCPPDTPVLWVQEEPENMGAWPFLLGRLGANLPQPVWPTRHEPQEGSADPLTPALSPSDGERVPKAGEGSVQVPKVQTSSGNSPSDRVDTSEAAQSSSLSPSHGERAGVRGSRTLRPVCRPESASPATGSAGAHKLEQEELMRRAFDEAVPMAAPSTPAKRKAQPIE